MMRLLLLVTLFAALLLSTPSVSVTEPVVVASIGVGPGGLGAEGIAVDSLTDRIYVANSWDDTVSVIEDVLPPRLPGAGSGGFVSSRGDVTWLPWILAMATFGGLAIGASFATMRESSAASMLA